MAVCLEPGEFFGVVTKKIQVGRYLLTESAYESKVKVPRHVHQSATYCYVLGGTFSERSDVGQTICDVGTVLFRPAGQPHSDRFLAGRSRCFGVEFEADGNLAPMMSLRHRVGRIAARLYHEMRLGDKCSPMAVEGLLLLLNAEMVRSAYANEGKNPMWLKRVIDHIQAEFRDPLSLGALAKTANVHPVHLCREFGRAHGCSPGEFMRKLRLEWACRELTQTDRPIGEIAIDAGFTDQSHFTRTLKGVTGTTPKAFRLESRA